MKKSKKNKMKRPLFSSNVLRCDAEDSIEIRPSRKGEFRLAKDVGLSLNFEDSCVLTTIPKGFRFDGASIPRFFWRIMGHPLSTDTLKAALVHDFLYATEMVSRKNADFLFRELMRVNRVPFLKRYLMYAAVRFFGGHVWCRHSPVNIARYRKIPLCEVKYES